MSPTVHTAEERRAAVRSVRAFVGLKPSDVDSLMACFRWRQMNAGDVLFKQGDYGDSMALVASGELSVRVRRGETEVEVAEIRAGEMVGEMSCIDPAPRSATLVALAPTSIAELSRDALRAMRESVPELSSLVVGAVIREVTRRLREIEERIDREIDPSRGSSVSSTAPPPSSPPAALASSEPAAPWAGISRLLDRLRGRT